MMGPGYGYNNDSTMGWSAPTPNANRASTGWTSVLGRFWNGLTGWGGGSMRGGMMGGGFGGGMMGGW